MSTTDSALGDVFVADAVSHAYNLSKSNYAYEQYAEKGTQFVVATESVMPEEYQRTEKSLRTDWSVSDTSSVLFEESYTDFAVFHPQSINIYKDGLTAEEKAWQFLEENPTRSRALADVDLIAHDDPQAELTRQYENHGVHGVKVYPSYWSDEGVSNFRMNDSETAFPLWEHCVDLGLDVVAVHKAVPLVNAPLEPYSVDDVDEAAESFPDLNFEIVHGGMTFAEETGWQIAKNDNVYTNLEITLSQLVYSPKKFVSNMEDLLYPGGEAATGKILWGSGATDYHPQLLLDKFWNFEFPEMESMFGDFRITEEHKRKILGENLMEAHNLDKEAIQKDIEDDKYSGRDGVADPWSTTEFEVVS